MGIATQEQTVIDKVDKRLYIGGEWRDASGGGTLAGRGPVDRRDALRDRRRDPRGRQGRARRRRRDAGRVGRHAAQPALGDPPAARSSC